MINPGAHFGDELRVADYEELIVVMEKDDIKETVGDLTGWLGVDEHARFFLPTLLRRMSRTVGLAVTSAVTI